MSYVAAASRAVIVLALFVPVFFSIFWTPGVLLTLFALVYASDVRAFSPVPDHRRRIGPLVSTLRRYRGGWLDSPTTAAH